MEKRKKKEQVRGGVRKERYYFCREPNKARYPRITVALIEMENGVVCKGLALCSLSEPEFRWDRAFNMSRGRAIEAAYHGKNVEPIGREEAYRVMAACEQDFNYKGYYNAPLHGFEKAMMEKSEPVVVFR